MNHEIRSAIGIILIVVVPLVLFHFRRSLAKWVAPLRRRCIESARRLLAHVSGKRVVWSWGDSALGKCPQCGKLVTNSKTNEGSMAFECQACGQKGAWIK
ncbi:hypothetical protein Pan181_35580 [Aeoliella mucimassa]|uniref:Uncharacterized protein n=1 Tax=Aeoliella mucimassa TaxID=2527972 RepID=A0A518ARJ6_9BACT|nr:hypothetical protein Pan181_35580 [Aeoliella mucimassa]